MPQRRKTPTRHTRAHWLSVIERHAESGLSVKAFCQREAIAYGSFVRWRSRLKATRASTANEFIELSAEPQPLSASIHEKAAEGCMLELQVGASVTLRIYAGR